MFLKKIWISIFPKNCFAYNLLIYSKRLAEYPVSAHVKTIAIAFLQFEIYWQQGCYILGNSEAFVGLWSCDNGQTERSVFQYPNWPRLEIICQTLKNILGVRTLRPKLGVFCYFPKYSILVAVISQLVKKLQQWSLYEVIEDILPFVLNTNLVAEL